MTTTTVEVKVKTSQSAATRKRQLHEINAGEPKDQQARATAKTKVINRKASKHKRGREEEGKGGNSIFISLCYMRDILEG